MENNEHKIFRYPTEAQTYCKQKKLTNYAIVKKRNGYYIMYDIENGRWMFTKLKCYSTDIREVRITYLPKKQNNIITACSVIGAVGGFSSGVGTIFGTVTGAAFGCALQFSPSIEIVNTPSNDRRDERINKNRIIELLNQNKSRFNELNKQTTNTLINTSLENYDSDKIINYDTSPQDFWREIIKRGLKIGTPDGIKQKNGDPYKDNHWGKKMTPCTNPYIERIYNPTSLTKGIRIGETELSLTDIDKFEFENMSIKDMLSYLKSHIKIDQKWKYAYGSGNGYYLNESKQLLKWMIITFIIILEN